MSDRHSFAAVILAAGKGTRMRSNTPKALQRVGGVPMIRHVLASLDPLAPETIVVVISPDQSDIADEVSPLATAVQKEQLGTAHALSAAMADIPEDVETVLVLYADAPLTRTETLGMMLDQRRGGADIANLGFEAANPGLYGRLILNGEGDLERIVEARDATEDELKITLCNTAIIAVNRRKLDGWLAKVGNDNAKGEYYLTDLIEISRNDGARCASVTIDEREFIGVDDRKAQARAEAELQARLRDKALEDGVQLIAPETVFLSVDTSFGQDVVVHPHVVFGPGVIVEDGVEIKSFSHLEGTVLRKGSDVGPYARLRPGTDIGEGARVGNFVEVKNTVLGEGAKANHLTYLGDSEIGAKSNIGAGTITCNYDGFNKARTEIGEGVFIGSNTALVAPVSIGDGAMVGAGSTISGDVKDGGLAVTRAPEKQIAGGAERFRKRAKAKKDGNKG